MSGLGTSLFFHLKMQLVPSIAVCVTVVCSVRGQHKQHKPTGIFTLYLLRVSTFHDIHQGAKLLLHIISTNIFSVITFLVGIIYLRKSITINKRINKNFLLVNIFTITLINRSIQFRKIWILGFLST